MDVSSLILGKAKSALAHIKQAFTFTRDKPQREAVDGTGGCLDLRNADSSVNDVGSASYGNVESRANSRDSNGCSSSRSDVNS